MNGISKHHHIFYRDDFHQDLSLATHVAIGAHPDDLEIMAGPVIELCANDLTKKFVGIVCTHGVAENILSHSHPDEINNLVQIRREEQLRAANFGNYFAMIQLGHGSVEVKDHDSVVLQNQLQELINIMQPQCLLTHNPFDRHQTHRAVFRNVYKALLNEKFIPQEFLGCEVWRSLDWVETSQKKILAIKDPQWIKQLISYFESQNIEGRDYGQGVLNRMRSNSVFYDSNFVSEVVHFIYALDLRPTLNLDPRVTLSSYLKEFVKPIFDEIEKDLTFC